MFKKRNIFIQYFNLLTFIMLFLINCVGIKEQPAVPIPNVVVAETFLFDDFHYTSVAMLESNGWKVRTEAGWPGIPNALWKKENVTFPEDLDNKDNRFLCMKSTIGQAVNQTQVCHQRKYLEGTYAARVRFTNDPVEPSNSRGDEVVQSFYSITPYKKPLDPAYSEMDFEYLPNGGWGFPAGTLMTTTWDTVRIEPWLAKNATKKLKGDYQGWHILIIQAGNGVVNYLIDGRLIATTKKPNYPDAPMSINFNLWFINNGKSLPKKPRVYIEEVDWLFHTQASIMLHKDIVQQVDNLILQKIDFHDNVPQWDPPLDCPCNL